MSKSSQEIALMVKSDIKAILLFSEEEIESASEHWSIEEMKYIAINCADMESQQNTAQMVAKILMNSLYGALGNAHFPLFNEDIACAITGNGRYFIRKLANYIEEGLQKMIPSEKPYITYGDTDSVYYSIEPFMTAFVEKNPGKSLDEYVSVADNFEKKVIAPIIQQCIDDFSTELNAYSDEMIGAEREIIADTAVFSAKKAYYARVRDNEGTRYPEDKPKIKVMGMDVAKSGTPIWSKKKLKEAIPIMLDYNEEELKTWMREIRQEYSQVPLSQICNVGGVNNLDYILGGKGIPFGSRSALVYNNYLEANNLDNIYTPVAAGDKTKRLFLQEPNKFKSDTVSFLSDNFTSEIDKDSVDLDTQYEKTFMNLLNLMVKSLNYNIFKETASFDDW